MRQQQEQERERHARELAEANRIQNELLDRLERLENAPTRPRERVDADPNPQPRPEQPRLSTSRGQPAVAAPDTAVERNQYRNPDAHGSYGSRYGNPAEPAQRVEPDRDRERPARLPEGGGRPARGPVEGPQAHPAAQLSSTNLRPQHQGQNVPDARLCSPDPAQQPSIRQHAPSASSTLYPNRAGGAPIVEHGRACVRLADPVNDPAGMPSANVAAAMGAMACGGSGDPYDSDGDGDGHRAHGNGPDRGGRGPDRARQPTPPPINRLPQAAGAGNMQAGGLDDGGNAAPVQGNQAANASVNEPRFNLSEREIRHLQRISRRQSESASDDDDPPPRRLLPQLQRQPVPNPQPQPQPNANPGHAAQRGQAHVYMPAPHCTVPRYQRGSGLTIKSWLFQMENHLRLAHIPEDEWVNTCIGNVSQVHFEQVRRLRNFAFPIFRAELLSQFKEPNLRGAMMRELFTVQQTADESYLDFMARIQNLIENSFRTESDETKNQVAVSAFVAGIQDREVAKLVAVQASNSVRQALNIATSLSALSSSSSTLGKPRKYKSDKSPYNYHLRLDDQQESASNEDQNDSPDGLDDGNYDDGEEGGEQEDGVCAAMGMQGQGNYNQGWQNSNRGNRRPARGGTYNRGRPR